MIEVKRRIIPEIPTFPSSIPSILQRIYAARGITSNVQLDRSARSLLSFQSMHGITKAVDILVEAIAKKTRIIVVGDFDADGATSSALSVMAFRMMGSSNVDYLVPNRFEDGYGLSPDVVDQAKAMGAEIIMTVDNGVSSIEGVAAAKAYGMQVVVTDHHLPGSSLPIADSIVNPNLEECAFPSKSLAGVGVAFYLMLAIRARLRENNWFETQNIPIPNLADLLDLVALGTVADLVALDENNRILVHQGIQRIRAGKCRPGIQALIEVANKVPSRIVASDFGFALGPRINAAGRLDDMSFGVELLMSNNIHAARRMAEAMAICERLEFGAQTELPFGLVLFQRDWHQGVIGILASRIKEKYHRPVIAFADGGDGFIKGSCRSISGFHMRDALDLIDTRNPGLILKFGGHAMAAGLTIKDVDYKTFSQAFDDLVRESVEEEALNGVVLSDGELTPEEFTLGTAEIIRAGGPWGQAFPEPIFDGEFKVLNQRLVGEKHLKLMLEPIHKDFPTNKMVDAIAFNIDIRRWPDASVRKVKLAYRLDINEFRGNQTLQLMVEYIEPM
jgi:single-stranded-DNA-specific exonuclease